MAITAEPGTLPEKWLKVEDAARYAQVGKDLIYEACRQKPDPALSHIKIDKHNKILTTREWIDGWLLRYAHFANVTERLAAQDKTKAA
jgi:hypothetical protein